MSQVSQVIDLLVERLKFSLRQASLCAERKGECSFFGRMGRDDYTLILRSARALLACFASNRLAASIIEELELSES